MYSDSYLEDTMDEAMRSYTESRTYKATRTEINAAIAAFRDNLTSETQKKEFLRLLNQINDADADFSVNAYIRGVKMGAKLFQQDVRK